MCRGVLTLPIRFDSLNNGSYAPWAMKRHRLLSAALWLGAVGGWVMLPRPARPESPGSPGNPAPAIFPLSEVRPGQVGEAFTVFEGVKPEAFKVRVLSVVPNFLPKQDIVVVRAEDPRLVTCGIAAGMSGSPVYVEGKLLGAIAYGWSFAKEPLAGVTPIAAMREASQRSRRPPGDPFLAEDGHGLTPGQAAQQTAAPALATGEPRLQAASLPLAVSGISDAAMRDLGEDLRPFGLVPVRSGGTGGKTPTAALAEAVQPGATVGVGLIRGDMNAVAMGTLTQVAGKTVLAFGHPFLGLGEVNLPLVSGQVHTIVASLSSSMKLVSPLAEIGAVVQDLPSGIVAELGRHAPSVPIEVLVSARHEKERTFRTQVALHRRLLPLLAATVVGSAMAETKPDVTDMVISMTTRLAVRGAGSVDISEQVFSSEGLSGRVLSQARGIKALSDLLGNPFAPAVIERMDVDVRVEFRDDVAEIVGAALPDERVRPGETLAVRVVLRPYAGKEFVESVPILIPRALAGRNIKIEVASGALVRPDMPKPESLRGLMDNLRLSYPAKSIVVTVSTPDGGVSLRGRLIPSLPDSALDTLRSTSQARRADPYRVTDRFVRPCDHLVSGRQELAARVREIGARADW